MLLNPVCVLLSGMFRVYKSDVRVAVFETSCPPKHWLRSIENRRIVWTCIFEAARSKGGRKHFKAFLSTFRMCTAPS